MKRKLKRLLCLMLSVLILTSITAGLELSANAQTSGDFEYTVLEDGTVEITDYTASESDVIIPSKIDGQSVSSISYKAFEYCENLESIIIPESVINIETSAIIYCPSLKTIVVDNDNPVYDSRNNCNAVIETDSNILMIGCASTVIPDGIVRIESDAFNGCKGLKSISIPDSVKSIGSFAFHQTSLINVFIPYSVEKIETSYQTYIYPN